MLYDVVHEREATYDDLLEVPDHLVAEIIDGELFTSPRPGSPHAYATGALYADLLLKYQRGVNGPGGWWFLIEPELHLGKDVFVPDIAGWRRQRMPFIPNIVGFKTAPDWICETVSPKTAKLDRYRKLPRYARYEIGHAWIVDPLSSGVEVYRLESEHWSLVSSHDGSTPIRAEPFLDAPINLGDIWLPEPPAPSPAPQS
jgi:Uma2 family endonuclease